MKQILLSFLFLLATATGFSQQSVDYKKKGAPIPNFKLFGVPKGTITQAVIKKNKPVMIMIFSPECEHCALMVDSLKMIHNLFKTTQIVMVAEERHKPLMEDFIKEKGLKNDPLFKNIGTGDNLIIALYTNDILPQLIFYNTAHKLVKIFDGHYKMEDVKKYVK